MSGISTRALRYYDEIGLLTPKRDEKNLYRVYREEEVDRLQQILFYRELDVSLDEIQLLLSSPDFDPKSVLQEHLLALLRKKSQLEQLIHNLNSTIAAMEGEIIMTDSEKFAGFKKELIDSNERKYGEEVREKYGEDSIEKTNQRISGLSENQWEQAKTLETGILICSKPQRKRRIRAVMKQKRRVVCTKSGCCISGHQRCILHRHISVWWKCTAVTSVFKNIMKAFHRHSFWKPSSSSIRFDGKIRFWRLVIVSKFRLFATAVTKTGVSAVYCADAVFLFD